MATAARRGLCGGDVVDVVAQGDKQVEKELRPAVVHLQLHRAAALEGAAAADDESQVVGAQLGVRVGGVGVGVAGRCEDGAALDARLKALLPQSDTLQLLQPVLMSGAVDDGVLEELAVGSLVEGERPAAAVALDGL